MTLQKEAERKLRYGPGSKSGPKSGTHKTTLNGPPETGDRQPGPIDHVSGAYFVGDVSLHHLARLSCKESNISLRHPRQLSFPFLSKPSYSML